MKKHNFIMILGILFLQNYSIAQDTTSCGEHKVNIPHYKAEQAFEVESLFPMFFTGGFHAAIGYRYGKFRLRASVINGGDYNAEPAGLDNQKDTFKRFYKTSPGFFLGYNIWKNLETYTFVEMHTFAVEQKATGRRQNIRSNDFGGGVSYQFFFGKYVYLQPGLHLYLRSDKSRDFNGERYTIPNADISPVIRIGFRIWEKQ
ncbi:hypothetical protein BDE36_4372 [Arcticibacter tournemirensis]|uniref:DUF3575 domain-containing protein n=1 Tax=Arcticibacter tournemirensis TaxID=699437 RepID=A0A5M9H6M1_9SPHI|nr:hypothetical protein [Arcticibacter tournemirensis]KAA8482583.1 hypothetical protein F1649_11430 [Arcticibacter tournemirensis]TQM52551.1 hypothetical protein BDE36_4372 [Arcticibacter tournemirensis]